MTESSSHNSSSPEITPKEEPITLDKPESPNPFLAADQVEFTFEESALTTNNEVALLYPLHLKSNYFETLDDSKIWVSTPKGGIRGDIGITTFRNALRAHYLPHSSMYVSPPSITIVRPWFATIGYSGEIGAKGTLKKSFLPPRWRLLIAQIIQCLGGKTGGHDQISNKDAIILYCLANGVEVDYTRLIWEDIIHKLNKKTRKRSLVLSTRSRQEERLSLKNDMPPEIHQLNMAYRSFDTVTEADFSHSNSVLLCFLSSEPILLIVYPLFQLFKTLSLDESRSPEYNLFSDLEENSEEEVAETMAETMEQYMSKTRADYVIRHCKYCPPARTTKKMEDINNFQQEPNETLYQAWERFKELLMKCPQHYLTEMREVILLYNGLDVPTRQILDSKGAIPTKTAADAKVAIQEMAEYSQNGP
ncbi:reverse transcriptase domain-containing protein [Tanacetum coccineum]